MATKLIKQSYPTYETIVGDFIINNRDDKDKVTLLQESWQTKSFPSPSLEFKIKDIDILIEALQEFNREVKNSRKIFAGFPCGMETNLRSNTVETLQSNMEAKQSNMETEKIKPSGRVDDDGSYLPFEGKPIKSGDPIDMSFAGSPVNAPKPWTLVKAEDKFSIVNYKNNPSVTIKDANGIEHTFDRADYYSPRHPE